MTVIPPVPDADDQFFWTGVEREQLLVQRCLECAELRHPPIPMCGHCHSLAWEPTPVDGRGTIYSWIVSQHPGRPGDPSRIVALIELDNGLRVVSNICDTAAAGVHNGATVELCFREIDGVKLPQFRLVEISA